MKILLFFFASVLHVVYCVVVYYVGLLCSILDKLEMSSSFKFFG